jgi:hypothetical protein
MTRHYVRSRVHRIARQVHPGDHIREGEAAGDSAEQREDAGDVQRLIIWDGMLKLRCLSSSECGMAVVKQGTHLRTVNF